LFTEVPKVVFSEVCVLHNHGLINQGQTVR
jgi:hypothetical protein